MSRRRSTKNAPTARASWWRGSRGEWLVVGQVILLALVFLGPRNLPGWPVWPYGRLFLLAGCCLMALGGLLLGAAAFHLGPALTPLPYPRQEARFVQSGMYGLVRHPIYFGALVLGLGWAACVQGGLTLGYLILLFLFLDYKARCEEKWLCAKHPDYANYQSRVRKLIPFVY